MPIIATPIMASPSPGAVGDAMRTVTAKTTKLYGCEIGGRIKAIETRQGLVQTVGWTMVDENGAAVDLTPLGDFPTSDSDPDKSHVQLTVKESLIIPTSSDDTTSSIRGVVSSIMGGAVQFTPTAAMTARAGIYTAEAVVYDSDNNPVFSNQFYYVVTRGLNSTWASSCPPSIAEIRLHLRDSGAKDNPLLDNVQFDLAEIALAIERPVLYWNESLPPTRSYTTTTFPYRYNWLEAIVGELYRTAAHFYRRNNMAVQGGGIGVNDLNKAAEYEQIADKKWGEYKIWALKLKVSANARAMIGSYGSGYSGYDGGI